MDWGNPLIIAVILGLVLLQFFLRRRKPATVSQEVVQRLLTEVKVNQALVEVAHLREKPHKFMVNTWRMNKTKLDFLGQSLQGALSDAFDLFEEFNQQIDAAKKHKSARYMADIDAKKLKEPLAQSKQGLEEWLLAKTGSKDPPPKYPSMFDILFGSRR